MRSLVSRERGLSLIELMVGIAIALILLTGVLTLMLRVSTEGANSVRATKLNQELRGTLDFISRDLQRAGYVDWFDTFDANGDGVLSVADDSYTGDNDSAAYLNILDFYASSVPAINLFGTVSLFDADGNACATDCSCILYSYDLNEDGAQGVSSGAGANQNTANFETFGIQYDADNQAVEMLTGGPHSCASGTWTAITDSNVNITDLSFDLVYVDPATTDGDSTIYSVSGGIGSSSAGTSCTVSIGGAYPTESDTVCLQRRKVVITLEGELAADSTVSVQLETDVKLKNDFLQTQ